MKKTAIVVATVLLAGAAHAGGLDAYGSAFGTLSKAQVIGLGAGDIGLAFGAADYNSFVGSFAYRGYYNDIIVTLAFTVLGLAMRRFDYNRPALFLGYVLGSYFERYLFISLQVSGPLFFLRPISLSLILITIAMFSFTPIKRMFQRRRGARRS